MASQLIVEFNGCTLIRASWKLCYGIFDGSNSRFQSRFCSFVSCTSTLCKKV